MARVRKDIDNAMAKEIASLLKVKILSKEAMTRGGKESSLNADLVNYFSIHGTVPNSVVAAKSHLCEDLHQHLINMAQNIKSEVIVPDNFSSFKGHDGQATVTANV